jgi:hypothetical protein
MSFIGHVTGRQFDIEGLDEYSTSISIQNGKLKMMYRETTSDDLIIMEKDFVQSLKIDKGDFLQVSHNTDDNGIGGLACVCKTEHNTRKCFARSLVTVENAVDFPTVVLGGKTYVKIPVHMISS